MKHVATIIGIFASFGVEVTEAAVRSSAAAFHPAGLMLEELGVALAANKQFMNSMRCFQQLGQFADSVEPSEEVFARCDAALTKIRSLVLGEKAKEEALNSYYEVEYRAANGRRMTLSERGPFFNLKAAEEYAKTLVGQYDLVKIMKRGLVDKDGLEYSERVRELRR